MPPPPRWFWPLVLPIFLAGCPQTVTPFIRAVDQGDTAAVISLINQGADINEKRVGWDTPLSGYTPLQRAARSGHYDVVKALLDKGADVSIGGDNDALLRALDRGHQDVVELLLSRGAKVSDRHIKIARLYKRQGIVRLLDMARSGGPSAVVSAAKPEVKVTREEGQSSGSDIDKPAYRLPARPNDFAVVIGVEKYSKLPEAQFAERDAEAVKNHLYALGFPPRNVIHLSGPNATRSSIQGYLEEWLPKNVRPDSTVFFYYSGHGAPDPKTGEAYLVPWDGNASFLQSTAYPLGQLYRSLGNLKTKEVIVALDSCFSGAGGRSVLAKGARPLVTRVEEGLPERSITLFAAASGEEITATLEEQGHGLFTYFFLKGLSGEAKDQEGKVSAKNLYDYLKPNVQDEAHRQNREQTPALRSTRQDQVIVSFK